jgi:outer membrane receptor protein involved in Fe transport
MCNYNNLNLFNIGKMRGKLTSAYHWKKFFIQNLPKLLLFLLIIYSGSITFAGTTGKLSGKVIDAQTGEGVVGANVIIDGTYLGAAADIDGYYYINNIPPGEYTVIISSIGYHKVTVQKVPIKIDLTYKLDVKMSPSTVNAKEVVITASRPLVQKDLTSTSVTVSANDIKMMPVESVGQIINLQAGVVGGHFRGGRNGEVAYLVDGMSVTDSYDGSLPLSVENSSIREMEVISGTFNAEYGQAMSGVVNIVTQDGGQDFHGSLSAYAGDYVTQHTGIFPNVGKLASLRTKNYEFSLSGPTKIIGPLTFFISGRYYNDKGYLYGQRIYTPADKSPYELKDGSGNAILDQNNNPVYIITHTGDSSYVPMNPTERYSFNGKLTYSLPDLKFTYSAFWNKDWNKYYDHAWTWTPDGTMNYYMNNWIHSFQISHIPSQRIYQTLKFSVNRYDYHGYVYADPYDPRYVDPYQGNPISNYTFQSGGQQSNRYERETIESILQWQLNAQVSKLHKIAVGAEANWYKLYNHGYNLVNLTPADTAEKLGYRQLGTTDNQAYTKYPTTFSGYIQDKAEYDIMIINFGLRFDYFKANSQYLADLRNPLRDTNYTSAGKMVDATAKMQLSPRLGISFPITDKGIIHFSYGHFFQIPNFSNLYVNSDEIVTTSSSLSSILGNPDLKAQKTVMYELGLQQVLAGDLALDFTVYYRDIRNLLGMEIINTYQGVNFARYINRDYGNVKGFILTLDKRFSDFFSTKLDYTYQIAEGDASDPMSVFYNNQTNPPIQTNKTFVPLDWDQRSTLNISFNFGQSNNWNVGLIFNYGSGFPYTEDVRVSQGLRFENGGLKPSTYNLDLRAEKYFNYNGIDLRVFLLVYNLLDTKNEWNVDPASGRANVDLYTSLAGTLYGLNTIQQYVNNPGNISTPRQLRIGVGIGF